MALFKRKKKAKLVAETEAAVDAPKAPVTPPFADNRAQYGQAQYGQAQYGAQRRAVAGGGSVTLDDLTVGDYAQGVPRIRIGEMVRVFGRNLAWAGPLFFLGFLAAGWWSKDFKRSYTGEGRILAQIASEYVYQPVAGQTAPALNITPDHIVLNEVGIMTSPKVIRAVWADLTASGISIGQLEPIAATRLRPGQNAVDNPDIYKSFEKRFGAMPRAKSSVIDMSFKHPDPDIAVAGLNSFMDAYRNARVDLFVSGTADVVSRQREAAEVQLSTNEGEIAAFLRRNNLSDFESEREGATERTEALKAELNTLRADTTEAETALREVEQQLRGTPVEIDLFVDDRASQRIAQAELELKQLLAKYLPTSDPVRQKQTEINELKSVLTANGGRAAGGRRVGPNPVYQGLLERRNELASTADALREKEAVLQAQLNGADAKTRRMRDLSPRFENLLRERETLQARLRSLNTKEQEALVAQQQAQSASENIREIFRADTAVKGRNMRMLMWAAATVVWGAIVFLLTLLATFANPRLYANPGAPVRQGASGTGRGRRQSDYAAPMVAPAAAPAPVSIPEPVAPYIPSIPEPDLPARPLVASAQTPAVQPNPYAATAAAAFEPAQDTPQAVEMTGTDGPTLFAEVKPAVMAGGGAAAPVAGTMPSGTMSFSANPYAGALAQAAEGPATHMPNPYAQS